MDKMTKSFITIMVIVGALVTFYILFGGYIYTLPDTLKQIVHKQEKQSAQANFESYMELMQKKIHKKWNPPEFDKDSQIVVEYKILKNGKIQNPKIIQSSGNEKLDQSTLDALKKVSPLPPLPLTYKQDSINVNFTFNTRTSVEKIETVKGEKNEKNK